MPDADGYTGGMKFEHVFSSKERHPYDAVNWKKFTAEIKGDDGKPLFQKEGVEFPDFWSQTAVNVVCSKYFRGEEKSLRQVIDRIVDTWVGWLKENKTLDEENGNTLGMELKALMVRQQGCPNSPVLFNIGVPGEQAQSSACFILSVEDELDSITNWWAEEARIFKYGSGAGVNLSPLRGSREPLANGGTASGPVSFMRVADAGAGTVKSGGRCRRAAKMVVLNDDHPDLVEFIQCKAKEEKKAQALAAAGYSIAFNDPEGAYASVQFQNANNSVRITDKFMNAVDKKGKWRLKNRTNGKTTEVDAREVWAEICKAAWTCGDPGVQFDTTINDWHTIPGAGRINASNPCSEYVSIDNSACNLASLNLLTFVDESSHFETGAFVQAVRRFITVMDGQIDHSHFPTEKITENSVKYRQLGLGYANLGALLMTFGVPYDSEEGRYVAALVTALMHFSAHSASSLLAAVAGPYHDFPKHRNSHARVLEMHVDALEALRRDDYTFDAKKYDYLFEAAAEAAKDATALFDAHGVRNSQVTVLAPTGTIGFFMDCDTTGIEPDLALVKYKKLVGGGLLKIVNNSVPLALKNLGYAADVIERVVAYIDEHDTIEGAPGLKDDHLKVFDCAFKPANGVRFISPMGHVRMMAAVQPFISGAISKTVNMPESATPEDIGRVYEQAWHLGVKAIAVYRDGCKGSQPMATSSGSEGVVKAGTPVRRRLPTERNSITHKFEIADHEGYVTVGLYEDGTPGEMFITISKEGSAISGLMDAFATSVSMCLQYGVPLSTLINKFSHMRFDPSGFTKNADIPIAKSIVDYLFRWMSLKFQSNGNGNGNGHKVAEVPKGSPSTTLNADDAPYCSHCGSLTVRAGSCYSCPNCGSSTGCG